MSAPLPKRLKPSREGLLLIKSFEGFRPQAVRRRDGTLVIGYGHTQTARPGVIISEAEAELLLLHDLMPVVEAIHTHIRQPLNQNQFDALASFILSIGLERFLRSDVLDHLRQGSISRASAALSLWPDRVPPPVDALYRRRSAERALFDTQADQSADLADLLTAPVFGSNTTAPTAKDSPTAPTIPVMRHETPSKSEAQSADLGALAFIGSIGTLALIAGFLAFNRHLPAPESSEASLGLGALLVVLGLGFILAALWNVKTHLHRKSFI